jgi:hypothetical protein
MCKERGGFNVRIPRRNGWAKKMKFLMKTKFKQMVLVVALAGTSVAQSINVTAAGVGIGIANPVEKLDVAGNIAATGNVSALGNVGVGTTAPTQKLEVIGNVSVSGNITVLGTISGAYFESAEQAYPTSGAIIVSVAHGLGVMPKRWNVVLRCKIAERGFSIGDEIDVSSLDGDYTNGVRNIWVNATTLNLRRNGIDWLSYPDGSQARPTPANWRIVFRASAKY